MKTLFWHCQKQLYIILCLILLLGSSGKSLADDPLIETQDGNNPSQTEESTPRGQMLPITAQAIITPEIIIDLEVAKTPEQQAMGLMFRDTLPDNRGMFFPFQQARIARFWMNNVPVALDMIFLKEGEVIAIAESVPPCTIKPQDCPLYGPDSMVDGVIELRAERAKELGIKVGDLIEIQFHESLQQK